MPEVTEVFAALGDPHRLQIAKILAIQGPMPLVPLVRSLPISRQAATKHLEIMERSGIVSSERSGRQRIVALSPAAFKSATAWLQRLETEWDSRLESLRHFVESDRD